MERIAIREIYVDCEADEVLLVKTIDALLEKIKRNRERIVCIIAEDEVVQIKVRRDDEPKKK